MLNHRIRINPFITQFLWVAVAALFLLIFLFNFTQIAVPRSLDPMAFAGGFFLVVLGVTWALSLFMEAISSEDFAFREQYLVAIGYWDMVGISVLILFGLEGFKYLVSLSLGNGALYFVGICLVNLLGLLICLRHGGDVGRTVAQIYFLDFLNQTFALCILLATTKSGPVAAGLYFVSRAVLIGLDFAKVAAFITMLSMPNQPGWPSLIPWMKLKRENPSTPVYDWCVRICVILSMLMGGWFAARNVPYEVMIHGAPIVLIILILRQQRVCLQSIAGRLPQDLLGVTSILDRIEDQKERAVTIDVVMRTLAEMYPAKVEKPKTPDPDPAADNGDSNEKKE